MIDTKPKIYFAGSIRGGREDAEYLMLIIEILRDFGEVLTEHVGDKDMTSNGETKTDEYIYDRDMEWLAKADVVVAEVTTPSLGVGYEIGMMNGIKPIMCLFRTQENKRLSAMIGGNRDITICEYRNMEDVKLGIQEFFNDLNEPT